MRTHLLALTLLSAAPAAGDECDARAARIAAEAGATVRTRIGPAIKMRHPAAESLSVDCAGPAITRVSGTKDDPGSSAGFLQAMATTTSLGLGVPAKAALDAMIGCVKLAASRAGTIAEASVGPLQAKCHVLKDYATFDITRR